MRHGMVADLKTTRRQRLVDVRAVHHVPPGDEEGGRNLAVTKNADGSERVFGPKGVVEGKRDAGQRVGSPIDGLDRRCVGRKRRPDYKPENHQGHRHDPSQVHAPTNTTHAHRSLPYATQLIHAIYAAYQ